MRIDEARQLFAYGSWANALMFSVAQGLSEEQLLAHAASSFPSLAATLGHIVGAEWIWLRRWLGESPTSAPSWAAAPVMAELAAQLAAVEAERASFVDSLSDADLDRAVSYRSLAGQAYSDPLDGQFRHVVNHSTYHRGQLATLLRQLGVTPPNTDLIRFLRQTT
jgi:uncharacterized damage-inducible protein DinB